MSRPFKITDSDAKKFASLWHSDTRCSEIGKIFGISPSGTLRAAERFGLAPRKLRGKGVGRRPKMITLWGKDYTYKEIHRWAGVNYEAFRKRLASGLTPEQAAQSHVRWT